MTSFTFNVGEKAMKHSTLVKKINEGADVGQTAKQELPKWNKAKDKDTG